MSSIADGTKDERNSVAFVTLIKRVVISLARTHIMEDIWEIKAQVGQIRLVTFNIYYISPYLKAEIIFLKYIFTFLPIHLGSPKTKTNTESPWTVPKI